MPSNQVASFSTHNTNVSIVAPGAGPSGCAFGVLSTIPANVLSTEWDTPASACNTVLYSTPAKDASQGRWAYGEGTSFAAPIVSAVAALTRQANPLLTAAQVADVLRRSATQTPGAGWNEYSGAGLVNAEAAVALARTYDTTPPALGLSGVPQARGIQTDVTAADAVDAGKALAGGVTIGLETSRDGVAYAPYVVPAAGEVHQLIAAAGATWLRATACDANHNCAQSVAGPLSALAPMAHPTLGLRLLGRTQRTLKIRIALGKGAAGKAVVQLESWTGTRWRAVDHISIAFGATAIRTEHVTRKGRYRLRARLLAGPSFQPASSVPLVLRVA
jgi:Subtilase family